MAPRSIKRSSSLSYASMGRAPSRSTLLMTATILRPLASAFFSTNRVCGIGPSLASTTSRAPSTMLSTRSTSPPKSAWPGVSTMLILVPWNLVLATLLRMVMPRSRSRSLRSITRSWTDSFSRNSPDWRNRASTRVVLPWSTWAMMPILRRFGALMRLRLYLSLWFPPRELAANGPPYSAAETQPEGMNSLRKVPSSKRSTSA